MPKGMPFNKEKKKPATRKKGKKGQAMPAPPPFKVGKIKGGSDYA